MSIVAELIAVRRGRDANKADFARMSITAEATIGAGPPPSGRLERGTKGLPLRKDQKTGAAARQGRSPLLGEQPISSA